MKTLYLVRHGKAAVGDSSEPDFDRTLMERGENDMDRVGNWLKELGVKPSLLVSSPAPRALDSAKIIARHLGYRIKSIRTRKSLYDQIEQAVLDVVHGIDDNHGTVMIFGHNPLFSDAARFFTEDLKEDLPTGGIVGIRFEVDRWRDVRGGIGRIVHRIFPKEIGKKIPRKTRERELEMKIRDKIGETLEGDIPEGIQKIVRKTSKELARKIVAKTKRKRQ